MKTVELVHSIGVGNTLGEGVLWNARTQTLWWTDIEQARLFEYDLSKEMLRHWDAPYRVACFGFVEDGAGLIVAFDRGIALYSPQEGVLEWLVGPGNLPEGVRFNDGRVDAKGRFWVGTMIEDETAPAGAAALYCYEPGHGLVRHIGGVTISNGLCWSPDGMVMYHADSARNLIRAYHFDAESGVPSDPRTFAETARHVHPDGSAVDAGGCVWNAQWGGGRIVRYTADGTLDMIVETPVSQPSCVAFGGADLDLLFVTSARTSLSPEKLAAEPRAGDLFIYRTSFRGLAAHEFRAR